VNRTSAYAATTGVAVPRQPAAPARERRAPRPAPVVRDLRDRAGHSPHGLLFGPRDLVVVTGLPGSGKSTLMHRAVDGIRIDSQDARDHWEQRMPRFLPYAVYRPLVRLAHYARLRRALRTGEGVVVHDCGTQSWVRGWLSRAARRRGGTLHLLLLDVPPATARASPGTPSCVTAGRPPGCCARWSGANCPRAAARRCCSTGTRPTCCAGSASRTDETPEPGTGTR